MECVKIKSPTWLEYTLKNPQITDICFNGPNNVFFDCGSGMERLDIPKDEFWSESAFFDWIMNQLSQSGKSWNAKNPFVDTVLSSGHRLHISFPPITQNGILLSIRRLAHAASNTKQEQNHRWQSSEIFQKLVEIVKEGESIIISGATGSGKTTLASDLLSGAPFNERIIALEDTPELSPTHPHFISLVTRPPNADGFGEVNLRTLLRQALRMRPDRIILGECRGAEIMDLLQAINTGHRGAMATLHANSAREALKRIELLCLLHSKNNIKTAILSELISLGIKWVVQVKRVGAVRKISELWHIEGREGDTILMRPVLKT